jgi:hypothetical protein
LNLRRALGIVIALTLLAQADDDRMKAISGVGTFRTWGDVRVESVMRFKADIGESYIAVWRKSTLKRTTPPPGMFRDSGVPLVERANPTGLLYA